MGNGCVALLNPFRGAFHGGADIDLSVTASTPNTNYSNVRTANRVKYNPISLAHCKSNQTIPDQTNYSHKNQKEAEERGALYLTIATLLKHFAKNITIHTKEKTTKTNPKQP